MANSDTIHLLKECDAGAKMAVSSIDDVLDKISNSSLRTLLTESKSHHESLGNKIHRKLSENHSEDKEPNMVAKGMSWIKTNMKMAMEDSDSAAADLITDGCNMGIKSLNEYLNKYQKADTESKNLCKELVSIEEKLCKDLRAYL